jgi:hypothetical protein
VEAVEAVVAEELEVEAVVVAEEQEVELEGVEVLLPPIQSQ